ncbi:nucleotidyltransferase family protein [Ideonella livida]|uniref:Nucleotidyltransferase family protein n=1 Tax=Ideonella livida TaxID=2707176 RepID=A0A7C9PFF0_9BURK|nr:nucleotidyltransferase family protein [Ideonella livida]NDY90070.1 nucleotidyltransferase family protein [Ideonella livida]
MEREPLIHLLRQHRPVLVERFGVQRLALFGSLARGTSRPGCDVDVLVDFGGPASPEASFGAQVHLEDLLGQAVDLVTERALRPRLRACVEHDAIAIG